MWGVSAQHRDLMANLGLGMKAMPGWLRRALGLSVALLCAKIWCTAALVNPSAFDPLWSPVALIYRGTLTVMLIGGIDLFLTLRARRSADMEVQGAAERAGVLLTGVMVLWVGANVPITLAIGTVPGWVELGEAGGIGAAMMSGLNLLGILGGLTTVVAATLIIRFSKRWPAGRTKLIAIVLILSLGFVGRVARHQVDHGGLERDPIGFLIESFWSLARASGNGA